MKNDYRVILIIAVVFCLLIAGQKILYNPVASKHKMLKEVERINSVCPLMIGEVTRLDSVVLSSDSKEVVLFYTNLKMYLNIIDIEGSEDFNLYVDFNDFEDIEDAEGNEEAQEHLLQSHITIAKINPEMRIFRINNMVISNVYMNENGKFLYKISVTPEMYNKVD